MLSTSISPARFCTLLHHPRLFPWAVGNMFCHQPPHPIFSVHFLNFYKTTFIHLCQIMFYSKLLLFLQFFSVTFISILYLFFPSMCKYGLIFSIQNISLSIHPLYLLPIIICTYSDTMSLSRHRLIPLFSFMKIMNFE